MNLKRSFLVTFKSLCLVVLSGVWMTACASATLSDTKSNHTKDIAYVSGGDEAQVLDVYTPTHDIQSGGNAQKPVLIYVHGGAWRIGDKKTASDHAKFYTDLGYVFVAVNYRMLPDFEHPAYVEDIAASIKWVSDSISHYGGDPKKIAIVGHSAGAHLVALLGSTPKYLQEYDLGLDVLKFIAPVDTASFDFTVSDQEEKAFMKPIIARAFGRTERRLADASPRQYVLNEQRSDYPPFLLFVTSERRVAVEQTQDFYDALKRMGADVDQYIVQGATHRQMNKQISDPESIVAQQILKALLALQ